MWLQLLLLLTLIDYYFHVILDLLEVCIDTFCDSGTSTLEAYYSNFIAWQLYAQKCLKYRKSQYWPPGIYQAIVWLCRFTARFPIWHSFCICLAFFQGIFSSVGCRLAARRRVKSMFSCYPSTSYRPYLSLLACVKHRPSAVLFFMNCLAGKEVACRFAEVFSPIFSFVSYGRTFSPRLVSTNWSFIYALVYFSIFAQTIE